jgi:hypothetical protein
VTTIYVSDVVKDAFPFLSQYIRASHSKMRKILSKISFDNQAKKIIDIYSSKAMGTLVYALSNLTFSLITKRNPSDKEEEAILGVSLISLSSSLFDDALDNNMDRPTRSYLVAMADLCTSLGFSMISNADIKPEVKSKVLDVVQKFQIKSWKANLEDHTNKWPTPKTCETSLDVIGFPLEAGTRVGAVLASGDQEYYAELGRAVGQAVALLDCILDTELDLHQGFFSRYPLLFALEDDASIKTLLESHQTKEAFLKIKHTNTITKCKKLLEEKLSKLDKYGLDIQLKSEVTI